MLRVALVITELDVGGAERQLTQLAAGLDRRFFKPRVYALGQHPPEGQQELVARLKDADVPVEFLHARHWWRLGPTVERLAACLKEFQPQVLQSFLFHANVVGTVAARAAGVPHVSLGVRVNDPSWWRAKVEGYVARRADRVVSVSQSVAAAAQRRLKLRAEQSVVIPNGVDVERFAHASPVDLTPFGLPPGVRPIVYIGRLHRQKGTDRLAQLLPMLQALDAHLLIVGGSENLPPGADGVGRIHSAGWQADVAGILAASSLLVLPSRYEGMPNAVLEAMAAGLPVVATPVEGVREILGEDSDGQAMPFEEQNWRAAIARFWTNPQLAEEVGNRNQNRVLERFSVATMVAQYERLWSGLAAQ